MFPQIDAFLFLMLMFDNFFVIFKAANLVVAKLFIWFPALHNN